MASAKRNPVVEGLDTPGKRIRWARKRIGLSQQRLAEQSGSPRKQTVTDWEADRAVPRMSNAARLADALGVSVDWILSGDAQAYPSVVRENGHAYGPKAILDRESRAAELEAQAAVIRAEAARERAAAARLAEENAARDLRPRVSSDPLSDEVAGVGEDAILREPESPPEAGGPAPEPPRRGPPRTK